MASLPAIATCTKRETMETVRVSCAAAILWDGRGLRTNPSQPQNKQSEARLMGNINVLQFKNLKAPLHLGKYGWG